MSSLLNDNLSLQVIRQLDEEQLNQLAAEIRKEILTVVSHNGGHLASNLGVVELTLALHSVFDTAQDKIVWDVGHQTYVHKILTGRLPQFASLRQQGGLSGFPKRTESIHDCFGTGHSSTSISAALGFAAARELTGEDYAVLAVIGDGALTGGEAWEGLDNASCLEKNFIVVLNDNEMSIAENVGAFSNYLSKVRTDPAYYRSKARISHALKKIPGIGAGLYRGLDRLKDSLKYFFVQKMLFEDLGFTYLGPIDGHNIGDMITVLQRARQVKGPVLVHVVTKKGKGYEPAEREPGRFHGIGPFELTTGASLTKSAVPSYTKIFSQTMLKLADQDPGLVAITAAMSLGTGLEQFKEQYPQRYFDVGIAEQHAVTFAAGLAASGLHPVVAIYSTFLQRAYDQVLHDVCLQKLPVVLAIDRSGIVGEDGPTHHGLYEYAYLRSIPEMLIMSPKDENELQHMLQTALSARCPAAVCYPRGSGRGVALDEELHDLPLGKAEVLRDGSDLAILAAGSVVSGAWQAAEAAAAEQVQAAVVNMRFIKPLDEEIICRYARTTGKLLLVEDHVLCGGFGSAVLEVLERHNCSNVKVRRLGIPDEFVEHADTDALLQKYGLDSAGILQACLQLAGKSNGTGENPA